jgi:hypothetical protein
MGYGNVVQESVKFCVSKAFVDRVVCVLKL